MTYRATEVKLIADLLSDEAESVEELAAAVIKALDQDRRKRDSYVVLASVAGDVYGIGPYPTRGEAEKVAVALRDDLPPEQTKGAVRRLIRPAIVEDDLAPKLGSHCVDCRHPMVAHNWPKSKIPGCVVGGCLCGKPRSAPV